MFRLDWGFDQAGYEIVKRIMRREIANSGNLQEVEVEFIKEKEGLRKEYSPMLSKAGIHRELAMLDEGSSQTHEVLDFCAKYGLLKEEWQDVVPTETSMFGFGIKTNYRTQLKPAFEAMKLSEFWRLQRPVKLAVEALDISLEEDPRGAALEVFNAQNVECSVKLVRHKNSARIEHVLVAANLYAAIWLLIEQEISGETSWKRCANCQKWFVPKTKRAVYCKDACKVAWHRKQKREA